MNRLWVRLTLAFLLVALLAVSAVALVLSHGTETSFRRYVHSEGAMMGSGMALQLAIYYMRNGTLEGSDAVLPGGHGMMIHGHGVGRRMVFSVADPSGRVVASSDPDEIDRELSADELSNATPVEVNGDVVGWLSMNMYAGGALDDPQSDFLADIRNWSMIAAAGAVILALVMGIGLAWQFSRPLRRLTEAACAVSSGGLGVQVPERGTQEMVELAKAFNSMSARLAEAEEVRRRMAADISHELRTPVSVIRTQLEAMLEGVYPLNAEHLAVAYDQVLHLARLVDDLRTLTLAESDRLPLNMTVLEPREMVERAVSGFELLAQDAGIELKVAAESDLPVVRCDPDRMQQVFANLLSNALRHTPRDGTITLKAERTSGNVRFWVINTGEPLSPDQADKVFDRFWRADDARRRDRGGAGLGLSITKQLIRLHGGDIWVETGEDWTGFVFELPSSDGDGL